MISIRRTDSNHSDFIALVKMLDADLAIRVENPVMLTRQIRCKMTTLS